MGLRRQEFVTHNFCDPNILCVGYVDNGESMSKSDNEKKFEETLKRMLKTPPKSHEESTNGLQKGEPSQKSSSLNVKKVAKS